MSLNEAKLSSLKDKLTPQDTLKEEVKLDKEIDEALQEKPKKRGRSKK